MLPSATQMVAEGKRLQEEAISARTHPGQEAGISQPAAATHQFSTQSDDGWVEASSSTTGAGTNGMLDGATPNAGRVAVGTPQTWRSAPHRIESVRGRGQGLRVDFDAVDSDEDLVNKESDAVDDMVTGWWLDSIDIIGHQKSQAERRSMCRAQDLSVTHTISMPITSWF